MSNVILLTIVFSFIHLSGWLWLLSKVRLLSRQSMYYYDEIEKLKKIIFDKAEQETCRMN